MIRFDVITAGGVAGLLACAGAVAATVYRWVDDQGRVHYSEIVPERFRGTAQALDLPGSEPDAKHRREALERARKEKERADAITTRRQAPPAVAAPAPTASRPAGKRPARVPDESTDCETWQRLYLESIECFGPYRTVGGGVKPQAFDVCNVVPEPPPTRCRLRIP